MKDDVRVKKGLDGLGAMGDIGWYVCMLDMKLQAA